MTSRMRTLVLGCVVAVVVSVLVANVAQALNDLERALLRDEEAKERQKRELVEVLMGLPSRVDELAQKIESLDEALDTAHTTINSMQEALDTEEARVDELEAAVEACRTALDLPHGGFAARPWARKQRVYPNRLPLQQHSTSVPAPAVKATAIPDRGWAVIYDSEGRVIAGDSKATSPSPKQ